MFAEFGTPTTITHDPVATSLHGEPEKRAALARVMHVVMG